MESFAGGSQIKTPEETVTTWLVSSSYCSVDEWPNHHRNNEGEEETKTIVVGEKMYDIPLSPSHPFIFHPTYP